MNPIHHDNCNVILKGEGCLDLPACRDAENKIWYTYWEPSEEDRRRIAAGGHVRLAVRSRGGPPPVMLDTHDWE